MYEPPLEPSDDFDCCDELTKYDDVKEFLEEVIHQVYNIGNVDALEGALDELVNIFNLKLPRTKPKLIKKPDELYDLAVHLTKNNY